MFNYMQQSSWILLFLKPHLIDGKAIALPSCPGGACIWTQVSDGGEAMMYFWFEVAYTLEVKWQCSFTMLFYKIVFSFHKSCWCSTCLNFNTQIHSFLLYSISHFTPCHHVFVMLCLSLPECSWIFFLGFYLQNLQIFSMSMD